MHSGADCFKPLANRADFADEGDTMEATAQRKTLTASVQAKGSGIVAKISTDSVDRDGEVLIPQGMNSQDFEKNPVLFYNHEYDQPVGKVENLKRTDGAVYGTLSFAQRPDGFQGDFFPEFVEALVRQGIIKGVSVGFTPEGGGARAATKADRAKFGGRIKRVFNKWKLLEVSIAPLPANQDALIEAVEKGLVTNVQVKKYLHADLPDRKNQEQQKKKKLHRIKLRAKKKIRIQLEEPDPLEKKIGYLADKAVRRKLGQLYL